MRILITGASGFIGGHLVRELESGGNEVVRFKRRGRAAENSATHTGSAGSDTSSETPWPEGVEALVHLAARVPTARHGTADDDDLFESNVEWTRDITARARAEGVKRIVFLSTANVHGLGRDKPYSEDDPLDPPNTYARSKKAAEEAFWIALGEDRGIGTVLRPPPVFGKGGHGPVAALVKLAKSRAPLPLKGVGGPRSVIAVDHLANVISRCLTHEAARGETFLVADDGPVRAEDIIRAVREGLDRPAALLPTPTGLLRMAAKAAGRGEAWEIRTRPYILDTARLKEKLGWASPVTALEKMRLAAAAGEL